MAVIATSAPLWMDSADAATRTWAGTTATMNTAANWTPSGVPTTGDQMLFNGSSGQNSPTLNATIGALGSNSIAGIVVASGQTSPLQINNVGTAGIVGLRLPAGTTTGTQIDAAAGAVSFGDGPTGNATFSISTQAAATVSLVNNSTSMATFASDVTILPGGGNAGTWIFDGSGNWQVADTISGTSTVKNNGAGTLTFSGANTYPGETVISRGTLVLANTAALQNSPLNYDNQGGSLDFGSLTSATFGGLASVARRKPALSASAPIPSRSAMPAVAR